MLWLLTIRFSAMVSLADSVLMGEKGRLQVLRSVDHVYRLCLKKNHYIRYSLLRKNSISHRDWICAFVQ